MRKRAAVWRKLYPCGNRRLTESMERMCFFIYIYDGKEAEYDKRHDELWPEMAQALTECGWTNYSLFREGTLVIGYVECIPDAATALEKMGKRHVVPQWNESFKDIIRYMTDDKGHLLTKREVWHHH